MSDALKESITRQFTSALGMLQKAIELSPEPLWLEGSPNRYWHIAYHALFYTHFYMSPTDAEFTAWQKHRAEYNYLGAIPGKPDYRPTTGLPYTQSDLLEYVTFCRAEVAARTVAVDLSAPSGFPWLQFTKLELQFYNLRHLAHHTGQLTDRLRSQAGIGVGWIR